MGKAMRAIIVEIKSVRDQGWCTVRERDYKLMVSRPTRCAKLWERRGKFFLSLWLILTRAFILPRIPMYGKRSREVHTVLHKEDVTI